ncbi:MAG: YkgJ family cysteine cluster protein [Thermoproteota archaeon]
MLVPWSFVRSWECLACGHCCKDYAIPLSDDEWLGLSNLFGSSIVERIESKKFLRMGPDGRCIFQERVSGHWICSIQAAKPLACRLFPFKVCFKPLFGGGERASFPSEGGLVYIYVDTDCRGIEWGVPGAELVQKVLPEFVRLKLNRGCEQFYSTSRIRPQRPFRLVRSIFSACTRMDLPLAVIA